MSDRPKSYGASLPALSEQIRQWRLARKLTQAGLEQKAGLSHNTVSRIECSSVSPRLDTIERIAQALDLSVEQLQFQHPDISIAESLSCYGLEDHFAELIQSLEKLPEKKRVKLIRTFMDLIRLASSEDDG